MIALALLLSTGIASAGRKRVVVLDLEGPKAEQFHGDLVKLLKKTHTVVSVDKWNGAAEELSASSGSNADLKKVAKKLKIDGIVRGTIEKRRDQYILKFKLHAGTTGKPVGTTNTKSEDAGIDANARTDLQDELFGLIDNLDANRGGSGDDDEAAEQEEVKPKKAKKPPAEEEEEEVAVEDKPKTGFGKKSKRAQEAEAEEIAATKKQADDERAKEKTKKSKRDAELAALQTKAGEDDEDPLPKKKKKSAKQDADAAEDDDQRKKRVATRDEAEDGGGGDGGEVSDTANAGMDAARASSPGERAIDAAVGLSFTARRMSFKYNPQVTSKPAGYQGKPVAGGMIDATIYPLAIGHKREGLIRGLGVTALYDKVFVVSSKAGGMKLKSSESRFAVGLAFRYAFSKTATSPVVGAMLRYGRQNFTISGAAALPSVAYTILEPSAFFKLPVSTKLAFNLMAGFMAVTDAGAIEAMANYGPATVNGVEGELGADYLVTPNVFARVSLRGETFGYTFKGTGTKSLGVSGARDTYLGGALTAGYLF